MIRIDVPGREIIEIEHVVLDYNGTIAFDGQIIEGAAHKGALQERPRLCAYG